MTKYKNQSQIILYQTDDGQTKLQVAMEDETVWLTQDKMATLFNKGQATITEHIQNIFKKCEFDKKAVCRNSGVLEITESDVYGKNIPMTSPKSY